MRSTADEARTRLAVALDGRAATKPTEPAATEAVTVATDRGLPAPTSTDSRHKAEGRRARLW